MRFISVLCFMCFRLAVLADGGSFGSVRFFWLKICMDSSPVRVLFDSHR